MRAVAHPTRLALLEALTRYGQLTATEAAELLGESPTNCAFHFRTLAKYGFVEEAGDAPGRRRPWRRTHVGFSVDAEPGDPAASELAQVLWETWLDRIATVNAARETFAEPWRRVTAGMEHLAYLTPEEAERLTADLAAVLQRHRDRLEDPSLRPVDSLPVELVLFTFPLDAIQPGR
jgi:predicted ArsR family transcriptional regulator